jgi:hypothetical protein
MARKIAISTVEPAKATFCCFAWTIVLGDDDLNMPYIQVGSVGKPVVVGLKIGVLGKLFQ